MSKSKKSRAKIVEVSRSECSPAPASASTPEKMLEAMLAEVRALPPGSDVEAFMEKRLAQFARGAREAMAQARADEQAAASEADFPPSGVSEMRTRDAGGKEANPADRDDVGSDRL